MSESLPRIQLTDPQAKDAPPDYPLSPVILAEDTHGRRKEDSLHADPRSSKRNSLNDDRNGRPASPITKPGGAFSRALRSSQSSPSPRRDDQSTESSAVPRSPSRSPRSSILPPEAPMAVDPVTQQIFDRTGTISPPPPNRQDSEENTQSADEHEEQEDEVKQLFAQPRSAMRTALEAARQPKTKDSKVSFFSRIIHGRKKDSDDVLPDDESIMSRPEGHDAEVFAPAMSQSETQSQAPDYIRVRTRHSRKKKHFDNLFLAQELMAGEQPPLSIGARRPSEHLLATVTDSGSAWAAEFSRDGKYLAIAGNDKVVRIWAVITTPEEREDEIRVNSQTPSGTINTAAIFKRKPIQEYKGHTSAVLDLSWSNNNFLLSSSMDKTVKLWHVTRDQCLCTFKHHDFVPSICFHPKDDRYFLTGSLDCKLRLWSIPEKRVWFWSQLPTMITAVAFSPEGKTAIAGCADGSCMFYDTAGLKYQTQVKVKLGTGKNSKGAKITGLQTFYHSLHGDPKLVITSNDSRVRVYNLRDKSLEFKLKGSINGACQIRAAVSDDGCYICCGSEDKRAYIWPLETNDEEDPSKRPVEHFQAHSTMVTCVRFAPTKTRRLIDCSSDPIFNICQPCAGSIANNSHREDAASESSKATETGGSSKATSVSRPPSDHSSHVPANRCPHHTGNIIVTVSQMGSIKIFRQDCAAKHRLKEPKKLSLSRRPTGLQNKRSTRSLASTTSTQAPSDRIMSWRQEIRSTPSLRTASVASTRSGSPPSTKSGASPPRRTGSLKKFLHGSGRNGSRASLSSTHITPLTPRSAAPTHKPSQDTMSTHTESKDTLPKDTPPKDTAKDATNKGDAAEERPGEPQTDLEKNPLGLQGEQSDLFWNVNVAKKFFERAHNAAKEREAHGAGSDDEGEHHPAADAHGLLRPTGAMRRGTSVISKLSIERSSGSSASERDASDRGE